MAAPDITAEITAFREAAYGEDVRSALIQLAQKLRTCIVSEIEEMNQTWNTYKDDMDQDWEDYQTALNNAWNTYKDDMDQDWEDYQTALNNAWNTYQNSMGQAWSSYQSMINGSISDLQGAWSSYKTNVDNTLYNYKTDLNKFIKVYNDAFCNYCIDDIVFSDTEYVTDYDLSKAISSVTQNTRYYENGCRFPYPILITGIIFKDIQALESDLKFKIINENHKVYKRFNISKDLYTVSNNTVTFNASDYFIVPANHIVLLNYMTQMSFENTGSYIYFESSNTDNDTITTSPIRLGINYKYKKYDYLNKPDFDKIWKRLNNIDKSLYTILDNKSYKQFDNTFCTNFTKPYPTANISANGNCYENSNEIYTDIYVTKIFLDDYTNASSFHAAVLNENSIVRGIYSNLDVTKIGNKVYQLNTPIYVPAGGHFCLGYNDGTFSFYVANSNVKKEVNINSSRVKDSPIILPYNYEYTYGTITNYSFDVYGEYEPSTTLTFRNANDYSVCNCKKIEQGGQVDKLYVKSYDACTTTFYIGEVDQYLLFVPRESYTVTINAGENYIDVSDLNAYIEQGEQILFKFVGKTPYDPVPGHPDDDQSFMYNPSGGMQLEYFGLDKRILFSFGFTVKIDNDIDITNKIYKNSRAIDVLTDQISFVQSKLNLVSDSQGNAYRLTVRNNALVLLAMNFAHVLCVGNSYTVHPTTTDPETDYTNTFWWGHWSMAASSNSTAWTTLLQNSIRQKNNNAIVTPIFGRRYETKRNTYNLDNPYTFTYWDGTAWQSLYNNLASFNDVDAIIFFLGANYSGDDWYTPYLAMVNKFLDWFPSATIFCCSSAASSRSQDADIERAAQETGSTYISMVGTGSSSRSGAYVYGDDGLLHQINYGGVASHYGDYGEYKICDRICNAIGYSNVTNLFNITISPSTGVSLSVVSEYSISGSVISVFATTSSEITLSSIVVTDENNNSIVVTDHNDTDYGRIFTFIMPASNVTINSIVS